jgi:hypothetical protein
MDTTVTRVLRAGGAAAIAGLACVALLWLSLPPGTAGAAGATASQKAQARKALLLLSDMPSGWTKSKSPNNNTVVGAAQLARCIGVATSLITENPPSVNSPQFQNRQSTLLVNDNVSVFPTAKNAAEELATIGNAKTPACMTTLASGPLKAQMLGGLPKGVSAGTPLVSATDPATYGTGTAGYSMSVPLTSRGVTLNVTVTQIFAVKGRLGQQVTFTSIGSPFSVALEQRLSTIAVDRL